MSAMMTQRHIFLLVEKIDYWLRDQGLRLAVCISLLVLLLARI